MTLTGADVHKTSVRLTVTYDNRGGDTPLTLQCPDERTGATGAVPYVVLAVQMT